MCDQVTGQPNSCFSSRLMHSVFIPCVGIYKLTELMNYLINYLINEIVSKGQKRKRKKRGGDCHESCCLLQFAFITVKMLRTVFDLFSGFKWGQRTEHKWLK